MTEVEASKLIAALVTAYPDAWRFLDEAQAASTRKMYRHMMRDLEVEPAKAACAALVATSKRMPSIAELRAAVIAQSAGVRRVGGEAWGALQRLIGRYGSYRSPGVDFVIEDPVLAACVQALGWRSLCLSEEQVSDRARFIDLYDQLAKAAEQSRQVGQLAASSNSQNPRREIAGEPAAIGDIVGRLLTQGSNDEG